MTQDGNNDQYLKVLRSVADCLCNAAAAFKQDCQDLALDRDDLDACSPGREKHPRLSQSEETDE